DPPPRRGHRPAGQCVNPAVRDLERAAALHWQAPRTQWLGEWLLRAADGFTGRANSALPLGDPGVPLPEAVAFTEDWHRRRPLRPVARPLLMPAPWQAFASTRRAGRPVAVGGVSVAGEGGAFTAVEVAPACRGQGLGTAITAALAAAAAQRGARRILLQVDTGN